MPHRTRRRTGRATRLAAALAAGALLVAGCSSASDSSSSGGTSGTIDPDAVATGWVGATHGDVDGAQDGGSLSYATYSSVTTLDPANRQDGGATGGTEMAAIYDVLMRFDNDSHEYLPQLAESLTPNADNTVWTLKLRDGVTFSDGTPLNSDAVVWSVNHYLEKRGTHSQIWNASVESTVAQDPLTVVYTLKRPWKEFPAMLTTGPGMIVAPSSMAGGEFTPVGAGPFTVSNFAPHDELALTARQGYWGGTPHLAELRFPAIVQEQGKVDAIKSGGVQAGYIRNVDVIHGAIAGGMSGWSYAANMSKVLLINSRDGRAGADPRVRQAIVAAVDPEVFDTRVEGGYGEPNSAMFPPSSKWSQDGDAPRYDPDKARALLDQAKADGFDGALTYSGVNEAAAQNSALAFQAMLQKVGFTVNLDLSSSISDLVKTMYAEHDYDIGYAAFNVLDDDPFVRLFGNLYSKSSANPMGYANPQMDDLLMQLQSAPDDDAKRDVLAKMQKLVDDTAPFATLGAGRAFIAMDDSVQGVKPNMDGIMLFDKAWIKGA
ncbi:ABC transporter substrate-binding protein [Tomitella fengzijianii]|uniref:ABC transporter substrate-binding protein n=1 Tax=Tomitella fengzijianii TaxID=2597660 RepID=A0A516X8R1_9ACTN|nr:ABC transporter substrate-binding protein [Tomitella fengzijianii]QDQ99448.1 ABC transporter substrate-binding protein [Tomitella fengzijianii]